LINFFDSKKIDRLNHIFFKYVTNFYIICSTPPSIHNSEFQCIKCHHGSTDFCVNFTCWILL